MTRTAGFSVLALTVVVRASVQAFHEHCHMHLILSLFASAAPIPSPSGLLAGVGIGDITGPAGPKISILPFIESEPDDIAGE